MIGCCISLLELLLTISSNFYVKGFVLPLTIFIISLVYLNDRYKNYTRFYTEEDELRVKMTMVLSNEEQLDSDEEELQAQYAKPPKRKSYQKVCLFIYVCMIILLCFMFFFRFLSLTVHVKERESVTTYPTGCNSWVKEEGCTRISIY